MKPTINFLFLIFFALFVLVSCQDDNTETNEPDAQETIAPNSELANLMRFASSNDGGIDNILDGVSCFSVNLPVTIEANGVSITINGLEDLELIESIFEEFNNDEDVLEFLFPITIIFSDYTEVIIEDIESLESYIEDCVNEPEIDECIDFQYPISFSIFNTEFDIIDTVGIENDEELYQFLETLEDDSGGVVLASINYPVTLVYVNGETTEVNTNEELAEAFNTANANCDEETNCEADVETLQAYLLTCVFEAEIYDGNNEITDINYAEFNENGEIIVNGTPAVVDTGSWNIAETNDGLVLIIENLPTFTLLNGNWLIESCNDEEFYFADGDEALELECIDEESECSAQEISDNLQECYWLGENSFYDNVIAEHFYFYSNGNLAVGNQESESQVVGTWEISLTNTGVFLNLNSELEPYNLLAISWEVVECEDDRIELIHGSDYLIFEQYCENDNYDCPNLEANIGDSCEDDQGNYGYINENCECQVENNNLFECFSNQSEELEVCDEDNDGHAEFNLLEAFAECTQPPVIVLSYFETIADAENYVNPIVNLESYTNIVFGGQTIYVRVDIDNAFEVFEITLVVENCNEGCLEEDVGGYLIECAWQVVSYNGSDDLLSFYLDFQPEQELIIEGEGMVINANWAITSIDAGIVLEFSGVVGPGIQAISGQWRIVECDDNRLELVNIENNNDYIVLEQTCD